MPQFLGAYMPNREALVKAARIVGKYATLSNDELVDHVPIDEIVELWEQYVESLSPSERKVKIVLMGLDEEGKPVTLEVARDEVPKLIRENRLLRKVILRSLKLYHGHFLSEPRRGITLSNPKLAPPRPEYEKPNIPPDKYKGRILLTPSWGEGWDDNATWIGTDFYFELAEWAEGLPVDIRSGKWVVKSNWDDAVRSGDYIFISHLGHGNYNMVTGYKLNVLEWTKTLKAGWYEKVGISFLSCEMGKILLHHMHSVGKLVAGDGYSEVFIFMYGGGDPPRKDTIAEGFIRTHLNTTYMLLQGHVFRDAFNTTNELFKAWAKYWDDLYQTDIAMLLLHDLDCHVMVGDPFFTVVEKRKSETHVEETHDVVVKNIGWYRYLTLRVKGQVVADDGTVVQDGQVKVVIGSDYSALVNIKDGEFEVVFEKRYGLKDIHEDVNIYFLGSTDDGHVFMPCEYKFSVDIPFEAEETTINIEECKAEKAGFPFLKFTVTGELVGAETGAVVDAQLTMWAKIPSHNLGWSEIGYTNKDGFFSISRLARIGSFFSALSIWLFGADAEITVEFKGDPSHRGTKVVLHRHIDGIFS